MPEPCDSKHFLCESVIGKVTGLARPSSGVAVSFKQRLTNIGYLQMSVTHSHSDRDINFLKVFLIRVGMLGLLG